MESENWDFEDWVTFNPVSKTTKPPEMPFPSLDFIDLLLCCRTFFVLSSMLFTFRGCRGGLSA